mgnify:CR=1 FL=1
MKSKIILIICVFLLASCSSPEEPTVELFSGSPEELVCQEEDLPGTYLLIEDLSGERPNEELSLNNENPEDSEKYIQATERLSGWENRFMLLETTDTLPGFVLCQVVKFGSSEGASTALNWPVNENREVLEAEGQLGDAMTFTKISFKAPDESTWIDYRVEFTYKNMLGAVSTYAPENIATQEFALEIAETLMNKFSNPSKLDHQTPESIEN